MSPFDDNPDYDLAQQRAEPLPPEGPRTEARHNAERTIAALASAGFTDDEMMRFVDALEASGLTLIPRVEREAASPALPSVDELAQIIREVDGNHDLGAGALAEAIVARLEARP